MEDSSRFKIVRNAPVIILDGVAHTLFIDYRMSIFDVCSECSLKAKFKYGDRACGLLHICHKHGHSGRMMFREIRSLDGCSIEDIKCSQKVGLDLQPNEFCGYY